MTARARRPPRPRRAFSPTPRRCSPPRDSRARRHARSPPARRSTSPACTTTGSRRRRCTSRSSRTSTIASSSWCAWRFRRSIDGAPSGRRVVDDAMGALFDFFADHPNVPKLLVRRLLENDESHVDIERDILRAGVEGLRRVDAGVQRPQAERRRLAALHADHSQSCCCCSCSTAGTSPACSAAVSTTPTVRRRVRAAHHQPGAGAARSAPGRGKEFA